MGNLVYGGNTNEAEDQLPTMVNEFLSMVDQPSEWVERYNALEDVQKEDLYLKALSKVEESIQKSDISRFEEFNKLLSRLNETDPSSKSTNLIILACKYNRPEILNHLLKKEKQMLKSPSTTVDLEEFYNKILVADDAGHTACYHAISSNNIDLLEALIGSTDSGSMILYESLCKDYGSLKLKNVLVHEAMEIFVEDRLVREHFLRDVAGAQDAPTSGSKNAATAARPEIDIRSGLNLIIKAAEGLNDIVSRPYVQHPRISIALFIARNLRVLKGQLKSTYGQLPWEEMEFYLSRYSFLSPVERKKLQRHLTKFVEKLKSVFGIRNEAGDEDHEVLEEIRKHVNSNLPINREKLADFEALYSDYELMKDEYSLQKILRYIQEALSVDPEEQSGMLMIQRALHVIGEYVKNSQSSPNLSESSQEIFISNDMGVGIDVAPSLRDTLSHVEELHVLTLRNDLESQRGFFSKLQADLKRIIGIIVHVFCFVKAKRYKRWCEDIIGADDAEEFEELRNGFADYLHNGELPDVEAPEIDALNTVEGLVGVLREAIRKNATELLSSTVEAKIDEVEKLIALEKKDMSNRIMSFNATFREMEKKVVLHEYKCLLENRGGDASGKVKVAETSKVFFKMVFYSLNVPFINEGLGRMKTISGLLQQIEDDAALHYCWQTIFSLIVDIRSILFTKSYSLMFTAIDDFRAKLDIQEAASSVQNDNADGELDDAFAAFRAVLGSEQAFQEVRSKVAEKKEIHRIKSKINGRYEENKDRLTENELGVVHEKLLARRFEGTKLLGKTAYHYDDFLSGKREFKKFVGSLVPAKSKDERSRLTAIYHDIESQHRDHDPGTILDETIRLIEGELTSEQYGSLTGKLEAIKQDHVARLTLASFFEGRSELEEDVYRSSVASVDLKSKTKLEEFFKVVKSPAVIAESLNDSYGALAKVVSSKESTAEKTCNAYVNFLDSLELDTNRTKLLKRTIIKSKILTILEEQFSKNLNTLKELLGSVETRDSKFALISRYRRDQQLQALVEMLLFDMCNVSMIADELSFKFMGTTSGIPFRCLERGFLYLNGNLPFLKVNSLRNYLAHGDALVDALPFDPSTAVISSAILFSTEGESLVALRNLVKDVKISKTLIDHVSKFPDQLIPEEFPADLQLNAESLKTLQRSDNWGHYLRRMIKGPVLVNDVDSWYQQYLGQCLSQVSLFVNTHHGDQTELVRLFESGEEIRSRDSRMQSLLHVAAVQGQTDIVKLLLDREIEVDAVDSGGNTALHLAASNHHVQVVKELLERGANVNAENASKDRPLHKAAFLDVLDDVAGTLLKFGADCNARNCTGVTALHQAAWIGNLDVIKLLAQGHKVNAKVEDYLGNNALHMAAKGLHDNAQVFDYLYSRAHRCINLKNSSGTTPLSFAVMFQNEKIVGAMLKKREVCNVVGSNDDLLQVAVLYGNVEIIRMLRASGVNVNDVDWDGCPSALHIAARSGYSRLVQFLVEEKFPVDLRNNVGILPLHLAAQSGDVDTIRVLIEAGKSDVDARDDDGVTPLHVAAFYNHINAVKYLLGAKADINARDHSGKSLLHRWIGNNYKNYALSDYLIDELHFDINVRDNQGRTPIAYALVIGTVGTIEYLANKGAGLDVRDNNGRTLLHYAVVRGNLRIVKYLLRKISGDLTMTHQLMDAVEENGDNILHCATKMGHTNIVNTLLETRQDVNFVNSYNKHKITPLYYAVMKGQTFAVELLLKNGADVDAKGNSKTSPLEFAAMSGFENIVKLLLKKGADPNRTTDDNGRPLLFAAFRGNRNIVEILLDGGAEVDYANVDGVTALHMAVKFDHYDAAEVLVTRGADVEVYDKNNMNPLGYAWEAGNYDMHFMMTMKATKYPMPFGFPTLEVWS